MKKITLGILAHVDAGKTTFSEALLYTTGSIRKLGRVDHRDTFLDTHTLERSRGITIFSKQALLHTENSDITLLDTPGHSDFSAETERTLQVLDYAVVIISGTDGVQAHTETLWELLRLHSIPVFLFITKMDVSCIGSVELMQDIQTRLSQNCMNFSGDITGADAQENIAMLDETLLDLYMETGRITDSDIARLIAERKLFPCFFGSGLKLDGIDRFLRALDTYTIAAEYPARFGARVYKISRDNRGSRLTYVKVTGGSLAVRDSIDMPTGNEKISQIRLYSGAKFDTVDAAPAGTVCAVTGPDHTYPGQGLGFEADSVSTYLEPAMGYRLVLPAGCDAKTMLPKLRLLEEEDPLLHIVWQPQLNEIHLQLMGAVQIEVLQALILERFDVAVKIEAGHILYRETISSPVIGSGHFEPLRHYAEVHLRIEPGERGSGVVYDTACSEDALDLNWQRLIISSLEEKQHIGVLTGSPLTDVKITLLAGRAHPKHTEGGDFRQASYRAVRQGLMKADSVLLEPYYTFRLDVPAEQIGRAISDIRLMGGTHETPQAVNDRMLLSGSAPVSEMFDYASEVISYTHGTGRLSCRMDGYRPCHNSQTVISDTAYDAERDVDNTADSVFCAHGAGHVVSWRESSDYMHLDVREKVSASEPSAAIAYRNISIDEKELEAIMLREFGPIRRKSYTEPSVNSAMDVQMHARRNPERILVDGYNVIHAWDELKDFSADSYDLARNRLIDMLADYQAFTKSEIILVFDAYRIAGGQGSRDTQGGLHIVYTKEGETADMYIEKLTADIGKNDSIRVVTSDNLIQLTALRTGVRMCSSSEFRTEVDWVLQQIHRIVSDTQQT